MKKNLYTFLHHLLRVWCA